MTAVCECACVLVCACSKKLISKLLTPHKAAPASTCHLSATSPTQQLRREGATCHRVGSDGVGSGKTKRRCCAAHLAKSLFAANCGQVHLANVFEMVGCSNEAGWGRGIN